MCFPVYDFFFCLSLDVGTKIIGIVYMVLCTGLIVLFGVPIVLAGENIPHTRACFYALMTISSMTLFISASLLLLAEFTKRPSLMRPWVITAWVTSVPLMAVSVAGMVTLPMRFVDPDSAAEESCVISAYFVHALLLFYFASVVNSRKRELVDQKNTKAADSLIYPSVHQQYTDI